MNFLKRIKRACKKDISEIISDIMLFLVILLMAVVIVFPILMIVKKASEPEVQSETATSGIILYMSEIQSESLNNAEPDLEAVENMVQVVAAAEREEKIKAEQEAIEEEKKQIEEARQQCLINYFGYVPAEDALERFYQIVMDECGYEPEDGIGAVADVIANRCKSSQYPNTIDGVIYQRGQFQPIGDGTFGKFEVTDLVREICNDHISEGAVYPYTKFRTGHYHSGSTPGEKIGNHYFSY